MDSTLSNYSGSFGTPVYKYHKSFNHSYLHQPTKGPYEVGVVTMNTSLHYEYNSWMYLQGKF